MSSIREIPLKLFTPGPLNTTDAVRHAMAKRHFTGSGIGTRDTRFISLVAKIRKRLLEVALHGCPVNDASLNEYAAVLLQGAGTFSIESVLMNTLGKTSSNKRDSEKHPVALIISNGAYGHRMAAICSQGGYHFEQMKLCETDPVDVKLVENALKKWTQSDENCGKYVALVAVVHCETSSGVINDIDKIGKLVKMTHPDTLYFVDAMSSFGAIPINMSESKIDFLVSSANKCIQGVPGFSYVIAKRSALKTCVGNCPSWSFDLNAQLSGLEANGQFRCTPPTHSLVAFDMALNELFEETIEGRNQRYRDNNRVIREGMANLGFKALDEHLDQEKQGYIITPFYYPMDSNFHFERFCQLLSDKGQVIYPGKVTDALCFRIGNIGDLHVDDCKRLLKCLEKVLGEMGVKVPVKYS